jgi:uncharacterized repeat protein (TIGR02543 family)
VADKVTDNTTLYAKWTINSYTVSFDVDGGTAVSAQTINHFDKVVKPEPPTKTGHTFAGWYVDKNYSTLWNFNTDLVSGTTKLYAKWNVDYNTVIFNTNSSYSIQPIMAEYNTTISAPIIAEKSGYSFAGWFKDEGLQLAWNFSTDKVIRTTTLYAKWILKDQPIIEDRVVDIEIGSVDEGKKITEIKMKRITNPNGTVRDEVTLTEETVNTLLEQKVSSARILLPDSKHNVDDVFIHLPKSVAERLTVNQIQLEFYLDGVRLGIPSTSVQNVTEDLFFHIVPIRDENEQLDILNQVKAEEAIKKAAGNRRVEVLGTPMDINTNMQNRPVAVRMPLGSTVSQEVLDNLVVFIEHSDGTKELIQGKIVTGKDGSREVEFTVSKFSTFVVIYVDGWNDYVNSNSHSAYIKGYSDNTFRPNENVTRAQMAVMLMRNLGSEDVAVTGKYDDVLETHWAYKEIMLAQQSEIMMGSGALFKPNANITRAQMATIIYRWLNKECSKAGGNAFRKCSTLGQKGEISYRDVADDYWAAEAILAIKPFGIMEGYEDGTFKPNAPLTRAQAVKVLNRLFNRGPLEGELNPTFNDIPKNHWAFREIEEAVREHRYILLDGKEIIVGE